jgi:hypothetical protein
VSRQPRSPATNDERALRVASGLAAEPPAARRLNEGQEALAVPPKQMWVVTGASHQNFLAADPAGYEREVVEFLIKYLLQPGASGRPS